MRLPLARESHRTLLTHRTVGDLVSGDLARGVNHSRILTGPPVRVVRVRALPNGRRRVSYLIVGPWTYGWRDLSADRGVTVQVTS